MTLGELIAVYREANKLSLRDLSKKTGISNPLLSQIENGKIKNTSFRTIIKLSRALNINLDRLARTIK